MPSSLTDLTPPDLAALLVFVAAWLGYGVVIHAVRSERSIVVRMLGVRRSWMHAMLGRDNRITDASLIATCTGSATFFASTTMVALAAMLGLLGHFEQTYAAVGELAFTAKTSRAVLELKLLLVVLVFVHAFLKLTWAIRQLNYCVALIGGAPLKPAAEQRDAIADRAATVITLAVGSFNGGIRGYYFALVAFSWLLGPFVMLAATLGILALLLWRQLGSDTAAAIGASHETYLGAASHGAGDVGPSLLRGAARPEGARA